MSLDARELVAALPEDIEAQESPQESPQEALQDLLRRLSDRPVPVGAFHRLWTLGTLQAKIAAAYLAYWIRSSYRTQNERERRLNETHLKAAIKLLGGMGYMRGVIMKVGQTLANYPNIVPKDVAEILGRLHFDAPPMHYSLLREHIHNELGADPEERFAEFETKAFAAASLGQVHRATLKTGERVAVKVQYPNIARTIQSDFRNMMALLLPMRLTKDWDNIREQWDDVRQMLEWETDYEREAEYLRRARALFDERDDIVVPRVFGKYSTKRVLTMEYLDGVHIDEYLMTNPSQEDRDRYGELMMRASFRIAHKARFWYCDSHPGNYMFLPDGRIGVLDFGCCREFTEDEWDYYVQVWRVYQEGGAGLREAMLRAIDHEPGQPINEDHVRFLEEYSHWWSDYMRIDHPFDFGDEPFIQRGIDMLAELSRKRYFRSVPVNIWITRQLMGLRALAHQLRARINMKRLGEEESWGLV